MKFYVASLSFLPEGQSLVMSLLCRLRAPFMSPGKFSVGHTGRQALTASCQRLLEPLDILLLQSHPDALETALLALPPLHLELHKLP